MSALTFVPSSDGQVIVHVGEPEGNGALGALTVPEAVRTAGELLRAAVGDEAFAVVVGGLTVGLDGADEESTGHPSEVLDAAWQALAWLQGQTSSAEASA